MANNPRETYLGHVTTAIMGAVSVYLDPDMTEAELADVEARVRKVIAAEAMFPEDFRQGIIKK